jgi:hypothetical protein
MTKPPEFREAYMVIQNIPYHRECAQDLTSDGVLVRTVGLGSNDVRCGGAADFHFRFRR